MGLAIHVWHLVCLLSLGGGGNLVSTIHHILPVNCTLDHSSRANRKAFNC